MNAKEREHESSEPVVEAHLDDAVAPARGIPDEMHPLWIKLAKFGAPVRSLASFEGYLAANAPMSAEQMEAGCKALHYMPDNASKSFRPLMNYIMNTLHDRYIMADKDEKKKILWVAGTLFSASHGHGVESAFLRSMSGIGENYLANLHEKIEQSIFDTFEHPITGDTIPLISKAAKADAIDLARTIRGRGNYQGTLAQRRHDDRNRVLFPLSINHAVTEGGGTIEDSIPSETGSPLEILLGLEKEYKEQELSRRLREDPPASLNKREQEWLRHFLAMCSADEELTNVEIGARMGVTESRITQLSKAAIAKIRSQEIEKATAEPNPPIEAAAVVAPEIISKAVPVRANINIPLSELGRIRASDLHKICLSDKEKQLLECITSMPETDVSPKNVSNRMQASPDSVNQYKNNIIAKLANEGVEVKPPLYIDLGGIDSSKMDKIGFSAREIELLDAIKSMKPEDVTTTSLANKIGVAASTISNIKLSVEKKRDNYLARIDNEGRGDITSLTLRYLGDIPQSVVTRARLSHMEKALIEACTSMPEEDITPKAIAEYMGKTTANVATILMHVKQKVSAIDIQSPTVSGKGR